MAWKEILQEDESIIDYARKRVEKKNQNYLAVFVGGTGSGKTYCALRMAEMLNPDFNADNIVFTAHEFVDVVNDPNTKKGDVIIFDEAGVDYDRRNWHSFLNKSMNHITQSFRYKNLYTLYTVPSLDFIDKTAKKLLHMYFETIPDGINQREGTCLVKPFFVKYNPRSTKGGDVYFQYPRMQYTNPSDGYKQVGVLNTLAFRKPSKGLIKAYEKRRKEWASDKYAEIQKEIELMDVMNGRVNSELYQKVKNEIITNPNQFMSYNKQADKSRIIIENVKTYLDCGRTSAKKVIDSLTRDLEVQNAMGEYVRDLHRKKKELKESKQIAFAVKKNQVFIKEEHINEALKQGLSKILEEE